MGNSLKAGGVLTGIVIGLVLAKPGVSSSDSTTNAADSKPSQPPSVSRLAVSARTGPATIRDVRSAVGIASTTAERYVPQVKLTWQRLDPRTAVQIVRNTRPSISGGSSVTLAGSAVSYVDKSIGAALCDDQQRGGCSSAPVHYWLRPLRNASTHYTRDDVVIASRTVTGTVAANFGAPYAMCCQNPLSGRDARIGGPAAVKDGRFTLHLPPQTYAICSDELTALSSYCWFGGAGHAADRGQDVGDMTIDPAQPPPSLDLVTTTSYQGIAFP